MLLSTYLREREDATFKVVVHEASMIQEEATMVHKEAIVILKVATMTYEEVP